MKRGPTKQARVTRFHIQIALDYLVILIRGRCTFWRYLSGENFSRVKRWTRAKNVKYFHDENFDLILDEKALSLKLQNAFKFILGEMRREMPVLIFDANILFTFLWQS